MDYVTLSMDKLSKVWTILPPFGIVIPFMDYITLFTDYFTFFMDNITSL